MTAVVALVTWVDQWLEVEGGQDVLDLMKSCARERESMLAGEYGTGVEVTRMRAARRDMLVTFSGAGIFTHDIVVAAGRSEARTATYYGQ